MSEWDYKPFWEETYKQLKNTLNPSEIGMWINTLRYEDSSDKTLILSTKTAFYRTQIMQKYQCTIEKILEELMGEAISLELIVKAQEKKTIISTEKQEHDKKQMQVSMQRTVEKKYQKGNHPKLNPNYTFNNFIIGGNNDYASNAAKVISKNLGKNYNPFLIYGGVGLGKTHLMQAIGHEVWNTSDLNVIYVTAEEFTNEFISSLHKKSVMSFKNKYRSADILLIDDIHFFQNKEGIQEELFHTFNALYESGRQIVFTCDRPPSELKHLSARLKSRFGRGINIDLRTPDYETRCAILNKKIESKNVEISQDVIELLAKNISTNVRDLEAGLNKLIAFAEIKDVIMTKEMAEELLRDTFGSSRQHNISVKMIQKTVADYFDISLADLRGKKRTKAIVFPRHIAMYLSQQMTENSTTELGLEFGGKDHSTIINGTQKIVDRIIAEPSLELTLNELKKLILEKNQ